MLARIFRPAKSATQSGRAKTREWLLQFAPEAAGQSDPLMGWTQSTDTNGQVRLTFDSREEAVSYAQSRGMAFEVLADPQSTRPIKAYADNFAFHRKQPWTH